METGRPLAPLVASKLCPVLLDDVTKARALGCLGRMHQTYGQNPETREYLFKAGRELSSWFDTKENLSQETSEPGVPTNNPFALTSDPPLKRALEGDGIETSAPKRIAGPLAPKSNTQTQAPIGRSVTKSTQTQSSLDSSKTVRVSPPPTVLPVQPPPVSNATTNSTVVALQNQESPANTQPHCPRSRILVDATSTPFLSSRTNRSDQVIKSYALQSGKFINIFRLAGLKEPPPEIIADNEQVKNAFKTIKSEIEMTENKLRNEEIQNSEYKARLDTLEKENAEYKSKFENATQDRQTLENENAEYKSKFQNAERERQTQNAENKSRLEYAERNRQTLEKENAEFKLKFQNTEAERQTLKKQNAEYKSKLEYTERRRQTLEKENAVYKAQFQNAVRERQTLKKHNEEYESKFENSERERQRLENENADYKSKFENAEKRYRELLGASVRHRYNPDPETEDVYLQTFMDLDFGLTAFRVKTLEM